jgi:hypothetical protein
VYRRYCKEDIEDIETNTSEDDRETWRERIRVYRRYRKEDIEDIETSTKMETAEKKEGKETARNEIGDKNRTTEERVDCEFGNTNEVRRD